MCSAMPVLAKIHSRLLRVVYMSLRSEYNLVLDRYICVYSLVIIVVFFLVDFKKVQEDHEFVQTPEELDRFEVSN
jgi:hypothetical protein